ncbi:MAG: single-stranded DNA-binding protein [Cyanothece sp. SIO1E1]|nr:single-stranded DNA-binding protein [Cyanothece sp. SIO1E1]
MNSCILMAEIIQDPQLRYTSDTQTPIAELLVQFPGLRAEEPPATLKVVGWGNLAQEIQERCHQGDRVLLEGRLSMTTIDRPEGFKEKRAELTVQRIHSLDAGISFSSTPASSPSLDTSPPGSGMASPTVPSPVTTPAQPITSEETQTYSAPASEPNYDDIPF